MQVPPSSISQICRYNPYISYLPVISVAFFQQTWSIYDLYAPWTKLSLQKTYEFFGLIINNPKSIVNNFTTKANSIKKELTLFEFKNCLRWTATSSYILELYTMTSKDVMILPAGFWLWHNHFLLHKYIYQGN